jgi:hypothetical protein
LLGPRFGPRQLGLTHFADVKSATTHCGNVYLQAESCAAHYACGRYTFEPSGSYRTKVFKHTIGSRRYCQFE